MASISQQASCGQPSHGMRTTQPFTLLTDVTSYVVFSACRRSPASENVGETKCSLDFATRARKVELGAAVRVSELSCAGTCSSPNSTAGGRDSPGPGAASSPSRASQPSSGGGGPAGVGSATNSPRVSSRYTSGASELRQSVTRRAAATSHKEEK
jgi:hypothetical protein